MNIKKYCNVTLRQFPHHPRGMSFGALLFFKWVFAKMSHIVPLNTMNKKLKQYKTKLNKILLQQNKNKF